MKKRDFGILWAGYGTYVSFVIYEMTNGKYKCYKNLNHDSNLWDKYRRIYYGSEKVREQKLTTSGRQGIDKIFNDYRDALEWVWGKRNG